MIRKLRMPGSPEFFTEVRAYMKREKINQTELAQRMGVDQSTVSRMMRGQTSPSVDTLDKLAAVMNKEVAELLYKYLGRPLPPIYEMVSRAGALGGERRAQMVNFALFLLHEQEEEEKSQQTVDSQTQENIG